MTGWLTHLHKPDQNKAVTALGGKLQFFSSVSSQPINGLVSSWYSAVTWQTSSPLVPFHILIKWPSWLPAQVDVFYSIVALFAICHLPLWNISLLYRAGCCYGCFVSLVWSSTTFIDRPSSQASSLHSPCFVSECNACRSFLFCLWSITPELMLSFTLRSKMSCDVM